MERAKAGARRLKTKSRCEERDFEAPLRGFGFADLPHCQAGSRLGKRSQRSLGVASGRQLRRIIVPPLSRRVPAVARLGDRAAS